MENRKLVRFLLLIFVMGFFIVITNNVFAYEIETHAYLTSEIIKFYNQNFSNNKIPDELKPYLIDGSRREDDNPRWMNHFYDPVYNRGLTYDPAIDPEINLGDWQKSKDWARDDKNQNRLTYKVTATIASILSAIEQKKISAISSETNFVWQEAIRYYIQGDKEKAFFSLGHILHLIEDTSVLDHTRNDAHAGDSPYEKYTKQFTLSNPDNNLGKKLSNGNSPLLGDLNSYFDNLARYSNNNFYSKDTMGIQSGYNLPQPDYEITNNSYFYPIKTDKEFGDYKLFRKSTPDILFASKFDIDLNVNDVMQGYWSRLSVKAAQYGAGVINLFFQEAEKAKNDPNFLKAQEKSFIAQVVEAGQKLVANIGSTVNNTISTVKDFLAGGEQGFQPVGQVSLNQEEGAESKSENQLGEVQPPGVDRQAEGVQISDNKAASSETESQKPDSTKNVQGSQIIEEEDEAEGVLHSQQAQQATTSQEQEREQSQLLTSGTPSFKECSFSTNQSPSRKGLIINEIAWMGTSESASNEWIELKNISSGEVDLTSWQLIDKGEQIKVNLGLLKKTKLQPGQFILLERTDDNSVPAISADLIYTGALSNSDEGLRLFDNQCNLIDEALASPDWPAGDNSSKKTMERDASGFGWRTSNISGGTPKQANSEPMVFYGGTNSELNQPSAVTSPIPTSTPTSTPQVVRVLISEIQAGATGNADDEFIELYNPTDSAINLNGWELRKRSSSGSESNLVDDGAFSGSIPPKGFFLIASQSYSSSVQPDISYSASSAGIAYSNNAIILYNGNYSSASVVDQISYSEIERGQSLERKALQNNICISSQGSGEYLGNGCDTDSQSDFEIRTTPNPQNSQSLPEPRQAPAAVSDFNVAYSSSTMELILNWQPVQNSTSTTSALTYEIQEYSSPGIVILRTSTSTEFHKNINEIGRNYNFSIQAFDAEGLGSTMTSTTIAVPSFLSNLYFYQLATSSDEYSIEAYYNQYPFISPTQNSQWKLVVFYLNSDATRQNNIFETWQPNDLSNVLPIKHKHCSGGGITFENTLILPDISSRCDTSGGAYSRALSWSELEDPHFIIKTSDLTEDSRFSSSTPNENYLTAAFYATESVMPSDGRVPYFQLVAVDKTRYYFQSSPSVRQSPVLSGALQLNFDRQNSRLNINWPAATDGDTLDVNLVYEIQYSSSTAWASLGNANSAARAVSPGDNLSISIRVKDDFNNYSSSTLAANWSYPETQFYISQTNFDGWSPNFGWKQGDESQAVRMQSIVPQADFQFNKVVLRIKQANGSDFASLRLSVYPDNGSGQPNFSVQATSTEIGPISHPDENQDLTFTFANSISAIASNKYWLVLDVSGYYVGNQWEAFHGSNRWQNAIKSGDPYPEGVSSGAWCHTGPWSCGSYSLSADDWYMKIGLE